MLKAKDSLEFLQEGMKKKEVEKNKSVFVYFLKDQKNGLSSGKVCQESLHFTCVPKRRWNKRSKAPVGKMVERFEKGAAY